MYHASPSCFSALPTDPAALELLKQQVADDFLREHNIETAKKQNIALENRKLVRTREQLNYQSNPINQSNVVGFFATAAAVLLVYQFVIRN